MAQQLGFIYSIRTKDEVTTEVHVSMHFYISPENSDKALFKLANPVKQIDSQVGNVVRAQGSEMTLSQLYSSRSDIAQSVSAELSAKMLSYGYIFDSTLVGNIVPPTKVVDAISYINFLKKIFFLEISLFS